jgi:Winged helix DNA-binding domain
MSMEADRVLTLRKLNRATLARQMLLEREPLPISDAIERLVGLQAQVPNPPYVGLWTRLQGFQRGDLIRLIEQRRVVRATLMRATLHLMTARDYLLLRPALQPALTRSLRSIAGKRLEDLDLDRLVAAARTSVEEAPRTFTELRGLLSGMEPDRDPSALVYLVRTHLPLVQTPPGGIWGTGGSPTHALAESWLGGPLAAPKESLRALLLRYLAAFGPASVRDIQTWSGLVRLKDSIEELKPELRVFRNESNNELLDLPDAPLPPPDAPAPPRFVPDYDNLVLAHTDRTRVISDEHRSRVFLSAARVRATFLLDGFVSGTWKIEKTKGTATLVIEPFEPLPEAARDALLEEGERLVRFVEDDAEAFEVRLSY